MDWDSLPDRYWHCYIALPGQKRDRERTVLNDATKDQIRHEIVEPWHRNAPFTVSGAIVRNRDSISEIRIVQTVYSKQEYSDQHNAEMHSAGIADMATDRRMLPFGKGPDYTSQLLFETLSPSVPGPDIAMLLRICERLPNAARILATRRRGKQSFELKDEYDAQDLLHSLIRGYFKFSIQEEPLGRVAGGPSSRADIAIEDIGAIIEIKYVRGPTDQNRIVEDFAKDLLLYAKWPLLLNFIYLVVNSQDLRDPEALEKLAGDHLVTDKKYRVYVVLV